MPGAGEKAPTDCRASEPGGAMWIQTSAVEQWTSSFPLLGDCRGHRGLPVRYVCFLDLEKAFDVSLEGSCRGTVVV